MKYRIGIDEAGRGPLAGPVAVGAFCVAEEFRHELKKFFTGGIVRDSKKLSSVKREKIFNAMRDAKAKGKISYSVTFASAGMIDRKGITFAIRHALARALKNLGVPSTASEVFLDGGLCAPKEFTNQKTIIKGDEKKAIIALASIAAKVLRDKKMVAAGKKYPKYDFGTHKGYGTKAHYAKIMRHGLSPIHRRSFLKNLVK